MYGGDLTIYGQKQWKMHSLMFVDDNTVFGRLNINCEDLKGSIMVYWCIYINHYTHRHM